jgi:hypothetical protein
MDEGLALDREGDALLSPHRTVPPVADSLTIRQSATGRTSYPLLRAAI